jgi:hypothetical protein
MANEQLGEAMATLPTIVAAEFDSRAKLSITPFGEAEAKQSSIQDVVGNSILDGFIKGSVTSFGTTTSYVPIPMFTSDAVADFYTSAPGNIIKAVDDTGLTVNIPVRYSVLATASFEGALNDNFMFTILVNGAEVDLVQAMARSGQGAGKPAAFPLNAYTGVLSPGDTIQIGAKDGGDTITTISASLNISFAGLI